MSNRVYDVLKFNAQIALPALGTLYFALATIWGLPNAEEIVGTITAVDAFLGVLLGLSTKIYNNSEARFDGAFVVQDTPNGKQIGLDLQNTPEALATQDVITFKNDVKEYVSDQENS